MVTSSGGRSLGTCRTSSSGFCGAPAAVAGFGSELEAGLELGPVTGADKVREEKPAPLLASGDVTGGVAADVEEAVGAGAVARADAEVGAGSGSVAEA